jgi:hypothetical protein
MDINSPFAVIVAAGFRVDNVQLGLPGEVFQVLYPEPV